MRAVLFALPLLISACGGGNTNAIASLTATNFAYGQLATLTLRGENLDHDIQFSADSQKCLGLTLAPATSSQTRTATCLVVGTGPAFFTVRSSAGYVIHTSTLQIPEPVTQIQSTNFGFGQVNLTLTGDPHNAAIRLSSDKCSSITLSPLGSGPNRTATCALLTTGPVRFDVTNQAGTTTLYSQVLTAPPAKSLSAANLKYGQKAYFAYPATPQQALTLRSDACTNINNEEALSTADTRVTSCTLRNTGSVNFDVMDTANNTSVLQANLSVPQPQVTLTTSLGPVVMELNQPAAPVTVDNFLAYVNQSPSFYAGTIFHRVISGFVVQGGGFTSGATMTQKTGLRAPITLESNNGLLNDRATVAMARTDAPNSATSQFYVNLTNNNSLNYVNEQSPGYAVFGRVITGMDVIDQMATKPVKVVSSFSNVPVTDINILSAFQNQ
jgi:cyclophilin family peptidyl-prolyl cis-trans isomerase